MKLYNKLVRDRIPEIIAADGKTPAWRTLAPEEYLPALAQKLKEEADEFRQGPCMEEMADILEVIDALCAAYGYRPEDVAACRARKAAERGAFEKRIYLRSVE